MAEKNTPDTLRKEVIRLRAEMAALDRLLARIENRLEGISPSPRKSNAPKKKAKPSRKSGRS